MSLFTAVTAIAIAASEGPICQPQLTATSAHCSLPTTKVPGNVRATTLVRLPYPKLWQDS